MGGTARSPFVLSLGKEPQYCSDETRSPPFGVPNASRTRGSIVFLMKCTEPSTNRKFAPPTNGLPNPSSDSTAEGVDARRAGTPAPLADSAGCQAAGDVAGTPWERHARPTGRLGGLSVGRASLPAGGRRESVVATAGVAGGSEEATKTSSAVELPRPGFFRR